MHTLSELNFLGFYELFWIPTLRNSAPFFCFHIIFICFLLKASRFLTNPRRRGLINRIYANKISHLGQKAKYLKLLAKIRFYSRTPRFFCCCCFFVHSKPSNEYDKKYEKKEDRLFFYFLSWAAARQWSKTMVISLIWRGKNRRALSSKESLDVHTVSIKY